MALITVDLYMGRGIINYSLFFTRVIMLFVHLGGESIVFLINGEKQIIDRKIIEKDFSTALLALYKKHTFSKIFVVQGPGSFTVLRIGVLLINSFLMLVNNDVHAFSLSKESFFQQLFEQKPSLPSQSVLFIGQRKNARLFDNKLGSHTLISRKSLSDTPGSFICDIEEVSLTNSRFLGISFDSITNSQLTISVGDETFPLDITNFGRKEQIMLQPYYGIEPNID